MTLDERVMQFQCLELPGQPMMMHMGTSYLVNDLHSEVKRLRAELEKHTPPEGMAIVPREITAETGHKAGMIGEFFESIGDTCPQCEGSGRHDSGDCDLCDCMGEVTREIGVSWTNIKAIHKRIVAIAEAAE